ncbi:MAG: type II secretion system protein [Burkholderiaceae bacterium]
MRCHLIPNARIYQFGFTYLGLMILIAIIGITSATTLQLGAILQRRAAEEELLFVGKEFSNALVSYAKATPVGQPSTPQSLHDLLQDPRYPNIRRHLRKLYADPITGKEEWGTIASLEGPGIMGVYSLSDAKPIKVANFDAQFLDFEGKSHYSEWKFLATSASVPIVQPAPAAAVPPPQSKPATEPRVNPVPVTPKNK